MLVAVQTAAQAVLFSDQLAASPVLLFGIAVGLKAHSGARFLGRSLAPP
jgi:hypothetical protein